MRHLLVAAASVASLAAAFGSAQAADTSGTDAAVRRLSIAQVDFRDAASVKAFYGRIHQAAQEACDASQVGIGRAVDHNPECTARTMADTINKIDRPLLTAEFQQHEAIRTARGY